MAVTIREIAMRAGVSPGAVSAVINGAQNSIRVGEKTRDKIKDIAERLQYRPNLMARGLRQCKTNLIGVVAPRIDWGFWPQILQGIESVLENAQYNLIFCSTEEDHESERRNLTLLRDRGVDGIIAVPTWQSSNLGLYSELSRTSLPIVCVARQIVGLQVPFICVDPYKMGVLGGEHLAGLGHRRIAFIGKTHEQVYKGFRKAISDAGIEVDENLIVREGETPEEAYCIAKKLLVRDNRPTAVFTTKEIVAIGTIKAVKDTGLRVPEDISVLSSDDTEISKLLEVPLSCIGQPKEEQGKEAARILLEMIDGNEGRSEMLEPYLVERRSTKKNEVR